MIANRTWVLLPSGRRLDLLNPDPQAWTDHDLTVGLSRTYRWTGYSAWDLPLSVAQHSLTVLAIRMFVERAPKDVVAEHQERIALGTSIFDQDLRESRAGLQSRLQSLRERGRLALTRRQAYR